MLRTTYCFITKETSQKRHGKRVAHTETDTHTKESKIWGDTTIWVYLHTYAHIHHIFTYRYVYTYTYTYTYTVRIQRAHSRACSKGSGGKAGRERVLKGGC